MLLFAHEIWGNYVNFRVVVIRFIANLNLKNEIELAIRLGPT